MHPIVSRKILKKKQQKADFPQLLTKPQQFFLSIRWLKYSIVISTSEEDLPECQHFINRFLFAFLERFFLRDLATETSSDISQKILDDVGLLKPKYKGFKKYGRRFRIKKFKTTAVFIKIKKFKRKKVYKKWRSS